MDTKSHVDNIDDAAAHHHKSHDGSARIVPLQQEAQDDSIRINLTWRSWVVVFVSCFACVTLIAIASLHLLIRLAASWPRSTSW